MSIYVNNTLEFDLVIDGSSLYFENITSQVCNYIFYYETHKKYFTFSKLWHACNFQPY